jgi:hypothetical protein
VSRLACLSFDRYQLLHIHELLCAAVGCSLCVSCWVSCRREIQGRDPSCRLGN